MKRVLFAVLIGCSGAQHASSNEPECKIDPAARDACLASGKLYTSDPLFGCSGTDMGESAEQRAAERRANACMCLTQAEIEQRDHQCMTMP